VYHFEHLHAQRHQFDAVQMDGRLAAFADGARHLRGRHDHDEADVLIHFDHFAGVHPLHRPFVFRYLHEREQPVGGHFKLRGERETFVLARGSGALLEPQPFFPREKTRYSEF